MNDYEPCFISEIDCIRRFILNSLYLQLHVCVKWLERKIKINDWAETVYLIYNKYYMITVMVLSLRLL